MICAKFLVPNHLKIKFAGIPTDGNMTTRMSIAEYRKSGQKRKRNKFGAVKDFRCMMCGSAAVYAGVCKSCESTNVRRFDSKAEAKRFSELWEMERWCDIRELKCQVPFVINVDGTAVGKYIADFSYLDRNGKLIVEDVKGSRSVDTAISRFKRKAVKAQYGITVKVVYR